MHQRYSNIQQNMLYRYFCLQSIIHSVCFERPPECVKKGCWCQGGHPVLGSRLPLFIPAHVMDQGLYGELSIQLVTLLSPCVLQYPNLATQLTHVQISFADLIRIFLNDFHEKTLWAGLSCEECIVWRF